MVKCCLFYFITQHIKLKQFLEKKLFKKIRICNYNEAIDYSIVYQFQKFKNSLNNDLNND